MHNSTIYLAGPIEGLTYEAANNWREEITERLCDLMTVLSPMRGKKAYYNPITLTYPGYPTDSIVARDLGDIRRSDVIVCRYLVNHRLVGTLIELGVALERRIPVVMYTEPGVQIEHPFLRAVTVYQASTIMKVVEFVRNFLL